MRPSIFFSILAIIFAVAGAFYLKNYLFWVCIPLGLFSAMIAGILEEKNEKRKKVL